MIRRIARQMRIVVAGALLAFSAISLADEPSSRLPIPSDSALKESQEILRDIFKDDIQAATTPTKRSGLAKKFLEQAVETKDDPAGRYALLQAAKNLAVRAGDLELAMKIVEELCRSFQVDVLTTKVAVIKEVSSSTSSSESNHALCEAALQLLPDILAADDYETAKVPQCLDSKPCRIEAASRSRMLMPEYRFLLTTFVGIPAFGSQRHGFRQGGRLPDSRASTIRFVICWRSSFVLGMASSPVIGWNDLPAGVRNSPGRAVATSP